jgi:hypothetical protein
MDRGAYVGWMKSNNPMKTATITQARGVFWMSCRVELTIRARAGTLWHLLTSAKDFPRWNSTVTSVEGQIREGERLRVRVPGTDRVFTPRVSDVVPDQRMTWTGGFSPVFKGVRTFELRSRPDGSTDFMMEERFSGLLLPLVKRSMPDFGPVFERYASDLKHEAELCGSNSQGDEYEPRIAS